MTSSHKLTQKNVFGRQFFDPNLQRKEQKHRMVTKAYLRENDDVRQPKKLVKNYQFESQSKIIKVEETFEPKGKGRLPMQEESINIQRTSEAFTVSLGGHIRDLSRHFTPHEQVKITTDMGEY